jgi:hypothetical protein
MRSRPLRDSRPRRLAARKKKNNKDKKKKKKKGGRGVGMIAVDKQIAGWNDDATQLNKERRQPNERHQN